MTSKRKFDTELERLELQLASLTEEERALMGDEKIYAQLLSLVTNKSKEIRNKLRVSKIDAEKDSEPAKNVLTPNQIERLPTWVRDDLDEAAAIGKSKKVIQTKDKRKYHVDNKLNSLSGGEWTYFLNSVIATRYTTSGEEGYAHDIRKIHPSPKPPQLMKAIIEFFTKENALVFDYFMGVGGTLLGASLCGRRAIGVDLSENYIDTYKRANASLGLKQQKTITGDSIELLKNRKLCRELFNDEQIDLILIDPPYGDMMAREKTGEAAKHKKNMAATPFTNLEEDLGNMDWKSFREVFLDSVRNATTYLKKKGHIVVFIKDLQPKNGETNLLHADIIEDINSLSGVKYLGTKIWADLSVNLYPYGYPHSYVSNQIHQYIMIFRSE